LKSTKGRKETKQVWYSDKIEARIEAQRVEQEDDVNQASSGDSDDDFVAFGDQDKTRHNGGDPNPNPNPGTKRKKPPSGDTPNSVSSVKGPQKTKRAKRASTTKEETPEDHLIAAIEG